MLILIITFVAENLEACNLRMPDLGPETRIEPTFAVLNPLLAVHSLQ